ncbi:hypothetical protein [Paracoccus sp. (in: a-proteobacteria)]|uniref:hypothetical protein n=1 Tax=Paracoccus sp. TaxID=267 RepID=UPI00289A5800|nr:hypothetical protein [Paracoccus sp. (in: a-proteobacteria)]
MRSTFRMGVRMRTLAWQVNNGHPIAFPDARKIAAIFASYNQFGVKSALEVAQKALGRLKSIPKAEGGIDKKHPGAPPSPPQFPTESGQNLRLI